MYRFMVDLLDRALSPLERTVKSLSIAYADVLKDSALVEASRQLGADAHLGGDDDRPSALHRHRAGILVESAAWLSETARALAEQARRETGSQPEKRGN
jgi:hypothetical protein